MTRISKDFTQFLTKKVELDKIDKIGEYRDTYDEIKSIETMISMLNLGID